MCNLFGRRYVGGPGRAVVAGIMVMGVVQVAHAGDGDFFSSIFGGGPAQSTPQVAEPQGQLDDRPIPRRPLTVKLHRPKIVHVTKTEGKPVKVSIFEDKTLRRGDAVMTAKGIRIFEGSSSWPYREDDFVAISAAGRMDKTYAKVLLDLDHLPRR